MLEENIREIEIRSEERLESEQKRNRDALQRLEREKELEIENYSIRLQTLEKEHSHIELEAQQLRSQVERLKSEKQELEDQLSDAQSSLVAAETQISRLEDISKKETERADEERHSSAQLIQELSKEVEELRQVQVSGRRSVFERAESSESSGFGDSELRLRVAELDAEVRKLRDENRKLNESNEEMQAQMLNRGLEEGKTLLSTVDAAPSMSMSIADELGGMSDFQVGFFFNSYSSLFFPAFIVSLKLDK